MSSSSVEAVVSGAVEALTLGGAEPAAWLATVITTWGSSPRPAGSMMLWSPVTGVVGSISGGCIEDDVLQQIRSNVLPYDRPSTLSYGGATGADDPRFSLPCGGQLEVLVEPLNGTIDELEQWRGCLQLLHARQGLARSVCRRTGRWSWQSSSAPFSLCCERDRVYYYAGPVRKLLVIGANPTAYYLAEFATSLDFAVTVCDPSNDIGRQWHETNFCVFKSAYPDGFVARDFGDAQSAVVTVSHDPRIDDMALLEALPSQAFYIGAMGSLATSCKRRERLAALGVSEVDVAKLHAPIGLDIGSKTPSEIAMSIAAHLVQCYAKKVAAHAPSSPDAQG
ncbi:MAG TPA: XdhC family protein [Marinagarivorans sp.]